MHAVFFGQYLLSQGIINAQQLTKALTAQEIINKNLGTLALSKNLLNSKQVQQILELQKSEDLYFGECAQKLGYLTQTQVDTLIQIQNEEHVCLGEVLVTLGYISKEIRDRSLADFIKEQNKQGKVLPPFYHLEAFSTEKPFIEKFTANTIKLLQRMSGIIVKLEKYETLNQTIEPAFFTAKVDHFDQKGKCVLRYILLLDKEIAESMHLKVCLRNNVDAINMPCAESLIELLNIICCSSSNSCQSLAQITASVPQLLEGNLFNFDLNSKTILVSLISPYGKIQFVLSFLPKD